VRDAADTLLELGGSYTPTGTWNWTSCSGCTWPTYNQNTTGSAGSLTGVQQANVGGDLACALAGDNTINAHAITGGSSTSSTITINTGSTLFAYVNAGSPLLITISGVTPSGYNIAQAPVTAFVANTSITVSSTNNPGAWSSGGNWSLACGNQSTDALVATPYSFQAQPSLAGYTLATYPQSHTEAVFAMFSSSTAPSWGSSQLYFGSSKLWSYSGALAVTASSVGNQGSLTWATNQIAYSAPNALLNSGLMSVLGYFTTSAVVQATGSATAPASIDVSGTHPIIWKMGFTATGVASGTYTSGGSITGSSSQTCTLTSFNNSSTATATVALTGTNTIAGGTALTITAHGQAATAAPTSATLGNGTATCSGTATIATVLGGAPGNAVILNTLTWRPN